MTIETTRGAPQESFGTQLNRMSGVQTERNLYGQKGKLDKDAFLKMFTEQLKNQDPLKPQDADHFAQQMATFSQLEQQMNTNKNLEKIIAGQSNLQLAALQLVGKNVVADQAAIYHEKDKFSVINFKLPQDALDASVQVIDSGNGNVLKTIPVGGHAQGDVSTKWDGMNEDGRPLETGRYSYKIVAKDMNNRDMTITTKVDGKVNGVTTVKGTVFLLVGDQKVGLNDVETIKDGAQGANAPASNLGGANAVVNSFGAPAESVAAFANKPDEKTMGQAKNAGMPAGIEPEEHKKATSNVPEISIEDVEPIAGKSGFDPMIPLMFR